jgi:hypothetical protein
MSVNNYSNEIWKKYNYKPEHGKKRNDIRELICIILSCNLF